MEIGKLVRKPLVKILTRLIGYGLGTAFAAMGLKSMETESVTVGLAEAGASLAILVIAGLIDKWHHNKDIAEEPPR